MKYIKKYNEDLEWEFDDEEESPIVFHVGDMVVLMGDVYEKLVDRYSSNIYPNNYRIVKYQKKLNDYSIPREIVDVGYRNDGKQIFKLKDRWPWFVSDDWKKYK